MDVNMNAKIIVEEEYGYRYWLWEVNTKSLQSLREYYNSIVGVKDFFCVGEPKEHLIGKWKELDWEEFKTHVDNNDYDGHAHIHQDDDSHIGFREL